MDAFYTRMYIRPLPVNLDIRKSKGAVVFNALRRFGTGVLPRRPLVGSLPALERLFIASPQ